MNWSWMSILFSLWSMSCGDQNVDGETVGVPDEVSEYCQLETMHGRCRWKSEVIVVTSARWGRMKTGRCLNIHPNLLAVTGNDPMFLGCSEDVISLLDKKCSGRSQCDVRIPDNDLDKVTPCYPDLTRFLEASYTCVKVVQESRSCLAKVYNEQQFISSSSSSSDVNAMSTCGTKSHPWRLEAPVGQRINISLFDFTGSSSRVSDVTCRQYGYVVDKSNKKNVSICGAGGVGGAKMERESTVYTSHTNSVDIVLVTETDAVANFLLQINAIGCTNVIPPDNAWLKRSNNDVIIGCYLSQQTWQLKCDGHEWKGQFGTCPDTYHGIEDNKLESESSIITADSNSKMFLLMVLIAGAAVILCITVVAIGAICLQRCKQRYKKTEYQKTDDDVKHTNACARSMISQNDFRL